MSDRVTLRSAVSEDCRRLWEWRNERRTREASFNPDPIPYEVHERWFARKLSDPCTRIFIVVDPRGRDIGYVRFDIVDGEAEISVSIDKAERGKGYGTAAIKTGSDHLLREESVQRIVAYIKTDNLASIAAFKKAGFVLRGRKRIAGVEACEMVYTR